MTQGETIIILLLTAITYFLYQIAKQLSHLTGRRMKLTLPKWPSQNPIPKTHPRPTRKDTDEEKLPN